jgi:hypothetical protein
MSELRYGRVLSTVAILVLAAAIQGESLMNIVPVSEGDVTRLPFTDNNPRVSGVDGTAVSQPSTTNFIVQYNLAPAGSMDGTWTGAPDSDAAMVYWLPWATNASSGYDLSCITTFVFGVRGTATKLRVEFESSDRSKTLLYLRVVRTNLCYYHIQKSALINDMTKMKSITFTANYDDVGLVKTGAFEVIVQGMKR